MNVVFQKIFLLASLLMSCGVSNAQENLFIGSGKIEFERRINLYARLEDLNDDGLKDLIKQNLPKFKSSFFDLEFCDNQTLYKPGQRNEENKGLNQNLAEDNIVFSDFNLKSSISRKNIYEKSFLLADSVLKIKWKITDETRNIAGYECRRANGLVFDSIYVVAFYCSALVVSGGPESFSGLPGMILGVAMPTEHISWFATLVTLENVKNIKPPTGVHSISRKELMNTLEDVMKDWGKWKMIYLKQIML